MVLSGVVVLLLVLSGVGSRVDEGYYRLVRAPPGPSPATAPILDQWESLKGNDEYQGKDKHGTSWRLHAEKKQDRETNSEVAAIITG